MSSVDDLCDHFVRGGTRLLFAGVGGRVSGRGILINTSARIMIVFTGNKAYKCQSNESFCVVLLRAKAVEDQIDRMEQDEHYLDYDALGPDLPEDISVYPEPRVPPAPVPKYQQLTSLKAPKRGRRRDSAERFYRAALLHVARVASSAAVAS